MSTKIPDHVAFIMDGNRRWARERKLPTFKGHSQGSDVIQPLVQFASEKGISYLTFWAFSTENWKRNKREISFLMRLFRSGINGKQARELLENNVRLRVIGNIDAFPGDISRNVLALVEKSRKNTGVNLTMALNYGGREELLHAVNAILQDKQNGKLSRSEIDEKTFANYLYTDGLPDPDIIVRTGGEWRLSGFLPWQGVYSEFFFRDVFWPDFSVEVFEDILREYTERERRFGG